MNTPADGQWAANGVAIALQTTCKAQKMLSFEIHARELTLRRVLCRPSLILNGEVK